MTVTFPPEIVAKCKAEGGCGIFSKLQIADMVKDAYREGVEKALEALPALVKAKAAEICRNSV